MKNKKITGQEVNSWQPETWSTKREHVPNNAWPRQEFSLCNYTDGTIDIYHNGLTFATAQENIELLFIQLAKMAILHKEKHQVYFYPYYGFGLILVVGKAVMDTQPLSGEDYVAIQLDKVKYKNFLAGWCPERSNLDTGCHLNHDKVRLRENIEEFFFSGVLNDKA